MIILGRPNTETAGNSLNRISQDNSSNFAAKTLSAIYNSVCLRPTDGSDGALAAGASCILYSSVVLSLYRHS